MLGAFSVGVFPPAMQHVFGGGGGGGQQPALGGYQYQPLPPPQGQPYQYQPQQQQQYQPQYQPQQQQQYQPQYLQDRSVNPPQPSMFAAPHGAAPPTPSAAAPSALAFAAMQNMQHSFMSPPTGTRHPLPFVAEAQSKNPFSTMSDKSLVFCLVLDNPFDIRALDVRVVDESMFVGVTIVEHGQTKKLPFPYLSDDELLLKHHQHLPHHAGVAASPLSSSSASSPLLSPPGSPFSPAGLPFAAVGTAIPNKFQKTIELILRLYKRGLHVHPNNMIAPIADPMSCGAMPNAFHGYTLLQQNLLLSPDEDEMYIKVHASRESMLQFAEEQGILLSTHPYSFAGGAPLSYSRQLERSLTDSVKLFMAAFPDHVHGVDREEDGTDGFLIDVPDKMRLVVRMMREGWQFGGCGIQIDEMIKKEVMVRQFFPMHSAAYQKAYGIDTWATFSQLFSSEPLKQDEQSIRKYFGESVALYFGWIHTFTLFQRYLAVAGVIFGILQAIGEVNDTVKDNVLPISNAIFAFICVVWGFIWTFRSTRYENLFAYRYGQEAQVTQELARDEYEKERDIPIPPDAIFKLKFTVPLTLKFLGDGTLVDLFASSTRRHLMRVCVTYPVIFVLTAAMVALQLLITAWRLVSPQIDASSNVTADTPRTTTLLSSMSSVAVSAAFGFVFDRLVPKLNALENNRTDEEEEFQTITKSFFFYFFSNYFAVFALAVYPQSPDCFDAGKAKVDCDAAKLSIVQKARLREIMFQMLFITVVKPVITNTIELVMPMLKTHMKIMEDTKRAAAQRQMSELVNSHAGSNVMSTADRPNKEEAVAIWKESTKELYVSTSDDYLEIIIQYGFIVMFASTFPWAAVASMLWNMLELRIDAVRLVSMYRRPVARPAMSIGAWRGIQFFLAVMSVITNGYLISVVSGLTESLGLGSDKAAKYKVFTIAQYVAIGGFYVVYTTYSGASPKMERLKAKHTLVGNQSSRAKFLDEMRGVATSRGGSEGGRKQQHATLASVPEDHDEIILL